VRCRCDQAGNADRDGVGPPARAAARARPTLSIEPLRGNIDTRLRKRGERDLDAVVLAACGLDRLGLEAEIGLRFDPARCCRGRSGLARLQVRAGEEALVEAADDAETRRRVEAERRVSRSWAAVASLRSRPITTARR
jgi:hydroxymethylbilane synthase